MASAFPNPSRDAGVVGLSSSPSHSFHKQGRESLFLLEGLGVVGDAHLGATVQHRSRIGADPERPNLRQVHLLHNELLEELTRLRFCVSPGRLGENVTTRGIDLLALPTGTHLQLGDTAVVEVTGLRNPCAQLDTVQPGLMAAVLGRDHAGNLVRKAGIMGVVRRSGSIYRQDRIGIVLPPPPHQPLRPV